ncbi:hypothetical protein ACF09H_16990 [Streptomyces sp. NPDC014983]|uniref:hypothetical protein n=1 Tax=Streptomyces sp. NPDC014983 TaxID=3364933 RepID=UPI0037019EC8
MSIATVGAGADGIAAARPDTVACATRPEGLVRFRWSEELDELLPLTPRHVMVLSGQSGSKGAES